jgi:hypothetical protein
VAAAAVAAADNSATGRSIFKFKLKFRHVSA